MYVLVYKEVELALTISSAYTKAKLTSLHPNIKVIKVKVMQIATFHLFAFMLFLTSV